VCSSNEIKHVEASQMCFKTHRESSEKTQTFSESIYSHSDCTLIGGKKTYLLF